jgi:hypothetical protein
MPTETETTWDTEEVDLWISNDEALYIAIGDQRHGPHWIKSWIIDGVGVPDVDYDNVDWHYIARENGWEGPS